ncbi:MAG TPA: alpha/beta fold hydrolase [Archangium sp.]
MNLPAWLDRAEYPWTPKLVDVGAEGRLAVVDVGTGPTLLFSHGTPTWSFDWRHLVKALSATHRCVLVDHLGFGLSERPLGADYSPEGHARRFSSLVDRLGLDRFTLVIHDFGGPFALPAVLEKPERLEKLVVFNTFFWSMQEDPRERRLSGLGGSGLFRWLYRHVNLSLTVIAPSAWGDAPRPKSLWRHYTALFEDKDAREQVLFALAKSMRGSTAHFEQLWAERERVQVPVLLVWGMKDSAFPPSALARCQRAWPHAKTLELPTAGHWPHEEQPAAVLEGLRAFL